MDGVFGTHTLAAIRIEVNRDGYRQLRRFAGRWSQAVWAVEGATGLGAALTSRLTADGVEVIDVPAKLARRVRMLSTGHGRKTDQADALSVGIAAHTATRLNTAVIDEAIAALRCLTEHRDDLVRTRTQTVNRLHALLAQLIPAGLPRGLTADTAAAALRSIRPRAVRGLSGTTTTGSIRPVDRDHGAVPELRTVIFALACRVGLLMCSARLVLSRCGHVRAISRMSTYHRRLMPYRVLPLTGGAYQYPDVGCEDP
jgi:hypothetical protein